MIPLRTLLVLVLPALTACGAKSPADFAAFADVAAMGKLDEVQAGLAAHPEWARAVTPSNGKTALHGAAYVGQLAVVKLLCEAGADPTAAATEDGATPLHEAAEGGRDDVVAWLLGKKVAPDLRDHSGRTPLHASCWSSDAQIGVDKLLLDAGAQVDAVDQGGFTPLLLAAIHGHTETIRLLLARGAKVDAVAGDGRTALSSARDGNYTDAAALLEGAGAK